MKMPKIGFKKEDENTKPKYCYACRFGVHVGRQDIYCMTDKREYYMMFCCGNFQDSAEFIDEGNIRIVDQ